jgi:signal transduction histidine kinase
MTTVLEPGPASAADEALISAFVRERFTDLFLGQNRRAQVGLLVAAAVVTFVWFQSTRAPAAWFWWGAAVALALLRFRYTAAFVRGADSPHDQNGQNRPNPAEGPHGPHGAHGAHRPQGLHDPPDPQSTRRIVWVLLANGLLMAVPLLAFVQLAELERAALSIVLLASATASVATTSGYRAVFVAFAAPMLLPLALAWAWVGLRSGSGAAWGLAGLTLVYLLFLLGLGRQAGAIFEESCRFRYGQQRLNRELTQALGEVREANRAKTQFLAAASHDLRQPIHSMNVLVAALSLRELDAPSREIVGLLGTVNQSLSKQLDTLLDVSKLDAGVVRADIVVQRLAPIVRAHHGASEAVASARGLRLLLDVQGDPWVATDAALFTRAVSNLTDNALKFTPAGGEVWLRLHIDGDQALLSVADTGIGIAADEQERVFREFYQVSNVERDRLKGLGLGLSIVRRLCALLQVQLQLQSQPGVGTTVTLRLPWVEAAPLVAPASALARPAPRGLRVLVVDDEAMVRQSMRLLLTELGCTVHVADGVASGAQVAAAQPLDMVLSDLRLRAGESGLDAIAAVRAHQAGVRAVLISGDTAPARIREVQAAGVPLLYKPVTLDDLTAVLSQPAA